MSVAIKENRPTICAGLAREFFFGCLRRLRRDPLRIYTEARRRYGDIVRFTSIFSVSGHRVEPDPTFTLRPRYEMLATPARAGLPKRLAQV